jgi:SAM-dependent methyltransferase
MNKSLLTQNIRKPVSRRELVARFCAGKDVLDIGCVNHDLQNIDKTNWQHGAIKAVAKSVLGLDYLEHEVRELNKLGYRAVAADISKPVHINERFDVIIVGNLIEHLSNFEGLMKNLELLLRPAGCILISTANPFFREQYFYSAFKNDIVVNAEHTCWLDPITLDQLANRFGLATSEVYWVKEKWTLGEVILNGDSRSLDIFTGRWTFDGPRSTAERLLSPVLALVFRLLAPRGYYRRVVGKHGENIPRIIYLRLMGSLFELFWGTYRKLIITSPVNRYELFVSVLRRKLEIDKGSL